MPKQGFGVYRNGRKVKQEKGGRKIFSKGVQLFCSYSTDLTVFTLSMDLAVSLVDLFSCLLITNLVLWEGRKPVSCYPLD